MAIQTPNLWPILLALISGLIGYQLNRRGKEKDHFLNELTKSYEKAYYPMYKWLTKILKEKNRDSQYLLLKKFFFHYSSINSDLKWISNFSLIENYSKIEKSYRELKAKEYDLFINDLKEFSESVKKELLEAHMILYQNHRRSKKILLANPALRIFLEFIVIVYYVTLFLTYLTLIYLLLSVINLIQSHHLYWLSIEFAIAFLGFILMVLTVIFIIYKTCFFQEFDLLDSIKSNFSQFKKLLKR